MRAFANFAAILSLSALSGLAQSSLAVINYSGFNPLAPVAPASIASAYGTFTGVATASWGGTGTMPRELSSTRVRVAGVDAPLYFVSASQINFNIPVATPVGRQTVDVTVGGSVVASGSVNVFDAFPALAASNTTATRPGIILNQDNAINVQTPAARGSIIQLYATGCGATTPPALDGTPAGGVAPTVAPVKAYVSVDEAVVQYAGGQPQFPGICQVNIQLPDRTYITGDVPVFITVNGVNSNTVSVRVQ